MDDGELRMLCVLGKRHLAKQSEVKEEFGDAGSADAVLKSLLSAGYVKAIEPMGEMCIVITQKGVSALDEAKGRGRSRKSAPSLRPG